MTTLELIDIMTRIIHLQADIILKQESAIRIAGAEERNEEAKRTILELMRRIEE